MKPEMMNRHAQIADNLRRLPRKILQLHGRDNITDFILHELCSNRCFNLSKAAYFIDNPAFNCLKGIVGISDKDLSDLTNIWENPDHFESKINQSPFHQNVRSFNYESRKNKGHSHEHMAATIAKNLDFSDYCFYFWDMKHENHGFLVCEHKDDFKKESSDDMIVDGLCLLSFCPIY